MADTRTNLKSLPPEETSMFCEQVTLILKSGIPLYDGIETLCENYRETRYAQTFERINKAVKESGTLYSGVAEAGVFPAYMVEMVKVGEASGKLDDVMDGLMEYYAREAKIRAAVKSALIYPIVLVFLMAVVIAILVSQVMPIFERVFRNLGTEMSASMTTVMNAGMTIGMVVLVVIAVVLFILAIGFILYKLGYQRQIGDLVQRYFPPVRRLQEKMSASRFASVISLMMTAGFPIGEAVSMTPKVLSDERTREKVEMVARQINEEGVELPKAIENAKIFEPIYNKMLQVGYYAGKMDHVMGKLGDIYEEDIDSSIRRLVSLVEPSLVAILAIIIGGILLAVMLPLASIMSSIL